MYVCIPASTVAVTKPHNAAIDRLAVARSVLLMSALSPCMARKSD